MVERNVQAGTIRLRTAWTDQLTKCSACTTLEQWLFEVSQYLATPQYARAHVLEVTAKTGKPKKIVWKPDPDTFPRNVTLLSGTSRIVPEVLYNEIMELRKVVQYDPQIYKVHDDIWLIISMEAVKVGTPDGGNTHTEPGLVIRIAHEFKIKSLVQPLVKAKRKAVEQKEPPKGKVLLKVDTNGNKIKKIGASRRKLGA